jgi:hypothetical protein
MEFLLTLWLICIEMLYQLELLRLILEAPGLNLISETSFPSCFMILFSFLRVVLGYYPDERILSSDM